MKRNKQYYAKAVPDEKGYIEARFSKFGVIDRDGDVITKDAISDGTPIMMVWHHDWERPIGKGIIYNDGEYAVFKGNFFLDTTSGEEAYKLVKNAAELQQYSWSFGVLKEEKGKVGDQSANFITSTEPFEVSPVLIGSNKETETVAIKGDKEKDVSTGSTSKCMSDYHVDGSYEALRDDLREAFTTQQFPDNSQYLGMTYVVATFTDHFIGMVWKWSEDEESYWDVPYGRNDSGDIVLSSPSQVEPQTDFVPVSDTSTNMSGSVATTYAQHSTNVQVALMGLVQRSKTGLELRRKDGRAISSDRRNRMAEVVTSLESAAKEIQTMLDETAPVSDATKAFALEAYAEFLKIEASLEGVV